LSRSLNGASAQLPLRYMEQVITRDERIPLSEADLAMEDGYRCIPIPPTADTDWFILDSSYDRRTVWGRWVESTTA